MTQPRADYSNLIPALARWKAAAKEARRENYRLRRLLRQFVDDDPCSLDHDGWCQTHHSQPVEGKCIMEHIREAVKR